MTLVLNKEKFETELKRLVREDRWEEYEAVRLVYTDFLKESGDDAGATAIRLTRVTDDIQKRLGCYNWEHIFEHYTSIPDLCPPGAEINGSRFAKEDVERIIAIVEGENEGDSWVGVFHLRDGRYATVEASCDYTGWG